MIGMVVETVVMVAPAGMPVAAIGMFASIPVVVATGITVAPEATEAVVVVLIGVPDGGLA
jgi:hypothetical protein